MQENVIRIKRNRTKCKRRVKRNNQIVLYRQIQRVYIQEGFGVKGRSRIRYRKKGGGVIEGT